MIDLGPDITNHVQHVFFIKNFLPQVICTAGPADVRATLTCLVTRLQKYCNTNIAPPSVMKVGLCGSDSFLNSMLRPYVELFSSKPPDWQNHILFYVIPLGNNSVSKGLAAR